MEIRCENCKAKLTIADGKIPPGQRITITCPKCKERLTLEAPAPNKATGPDPGPGYAAETTPLEFYDESIKLALVAEYDSDQRKKTEESLDDMGYKCISAENTGQAISKMRFNRFDLVLISNPFDAIELDQSPILQYLNHLSMSIRRKIFVVLVADHFNTMDQMMAFNMSANLVINRRDLDKLGGILKNAISDNENFYRVFMETLTEVGKA